MARRTFLTALAASMVALPSGCGILGPSRYRFKLTVEADTSGGPLFGSSVYEVTAYNTLNLTSEEKGGGGGIRGQATILDLPSGPVFALLRTSTVGEGLDEVATVAMRPDAGTGHFRDYLQAVRSLGGWFGRSRAELPSKDWPLLARFGNINDPATAELVNPTSIGVKRVIVETIAADVSEGIETRLIWLGHDRLTLGERGTMGPPMAGSYLQNGDFWRS